MTASSARPDRLRTARDDRPAPDHRLGLEGPATRRMAHVLERAAGEAPTARVALRALGAALVAPTGAQFDDTDPEDRALLVRLLVGLGGRFALERWEFEAIPADPPEGALVLAKRRPQRSRGLLGWGQIATRAELARWADRAPQPDPDDNTEPDDDGDDLPSLADLPARLRRTAAADDWAAARAVCRNPAGLPPVTFGGGVPVPTTTARPLVVANGLTPSTGCTRGADGVPCGLARGGRWTCHRCGAVTRIVERVPGPRVTACGCLEVVCLHPAPGAPPPTTGAPPARPRAQRRAS